MTGAWSTGGVGAIPRQLDAQLQSMSAPSLRLGHGFIPAHDVHALLPCEAAFFKDAIPAVRRQSAAARNVARHLLRHFDLGNAAIPRHSRTHGPVWPAGIVGSMAHEAHVAIAAVARLADVRSLGVDIEPDLPLPKEAFASVCTPGERDRYPHAIVTSRRLFVAKEAAFKAAHPIDGIALDFQDIDIDLASGTARLCYGRTVKFVLTCSPYIVALARIDT
jgi:4'-phosphopantetheinyl transferase EntD